jgi:hypothetical protein
VTRDAALAARLRRVKGQGQSEVRRYWHTELGFNYRMTNVCAAIGLAQLEHFEAIANRKRAIFDHYRRLLANLPVTLQKPLAGVQAADWLFTLLLPEGTARWRDGVDGIAGDRDAPQLLLRASDADVRQHAELPCFRGCLPAGFKHAELSGNARGGRRARRRCIARGIGATPPKRRPSAGRGRAARDGCGLKVAARHLVGWLLNCDSAWRR